MAKKPILEIVEGPLKGKEFAVGNDYVIGRADECEINTGDKTTSRKHAIIAVEKDGYRVVDNDSANGMLVNRKKVKSHFLRHGDKITVGDTTFEIKFLVDPKTKRRNFLTFMIIIVLVAGGATVVFLQQQSAQFARTAPVYSPFDRIYDNQSFGFKVHYPSDFQTSERDYVTRLWLRNIYELWGTNYPEVGNMLVNEKIAFDGFLNVKFNKIVAAEYYEFARFTVDAYSGLGNFVDLYDFSLTDVALPVPAADDMHFEENLVASAEHPDYGPYEEAEKVYDAGGELNGEPVRFYSKQRLYLVGSRRYLLTATTNAKMISRTKEMFTEFFDKFEIDVEAATARAPRDDQTIFREAETVLAEARRMEGAATGYRDKYMAYRRYVATTKLLKTMQTRTNELSESTTAAIRLRDEIQRQLRELRDRIRDDTNRNRFKDAENGIIKIEEMLTLDGNDPFRPDYEEEWLIWKDRGTEDIIRQGNEWAK